MKIPNKVLLTVEFSSSADVPLELPEGQSSDTIYNYFVDGNTAHLIFVDGTEATYNDCEIEEQDCVDINCDVDTIFESDLENYDTFFKPQTPKKG